MAKKKTNSINKYLNQLLNENPEAVQKKWPEIKTGAMQVALAIFNNMRNGDTKTIKDTIDRMDGKAVTPMDVEHDIEVTIVYDQKD